MPRRRTSVNTAPLRATAAAAYDSRMDLNPAQHDAVSTLAGPLLVLAGAGTGKTRVVTYRIAELIRNRTPPERILAVTFTNKAADEMQQRAAALLGKRLEQQPEISTFHSLVRPHPPPPHPASWAIRPASPSTTGAIRKAWPAPRCGEIKAADGLLRPGDLLYFIGRWKTASVRPEPAATLAQTDKEHLAAAAYRRYQNALRAAGAMDFDDLLLCDRGTFCEVPQEPRRPRPTDSTTCWSTNIRTPTPASTASSSTWRPAIATCAWWATTISRSTAGGARRWPTSSASSRIGPTPRSSAWRSITARRARSSTGRTG